jgi:putative alpha-1,2-mannosidase
VDAISKNTLQDFPSFSGLTGTLSSAPPLNMVPRPCSLLSFLLKVYFGLQYVVTGIFAEDFTQHVNPFIGTEGQGHPGTAISGGNVFPGAALPFGVVKFGIDTTAFDWTNVDANAGYTPDGYGRSSISHNWLTFANC